MEVRGGLCAIGVKLMYTSGVLCGRGVCVKVEICKEVEFNSSENGSRFRGRCEL